MILSPSLLSCDFYHVKSQLISLYEAGIRNLHLDVMDGAFVPNISFGPPVISKIKKGCEKDGLHFHFDVHLMVEEPSRFIADYVKAGADGITVHFEACRHLDSCLNMIKKAGLQCGVSLNPSTPLCVLEEILPMADMVLLMSVNPGFGGQSLIPYVLEKIKKLDEIRKEKKLAFSIQVDGGVNADTLEAVLASGVDNIVAGSAIFDGNLAENVKMFQENMQQRR